MAKLTFYGASDDLVEFEGAISEEFNAYRAWRGRLQSPDGQSLILTAEFGASRRLSEWTLGVENNDVDTPDWPIQFGQRPDRDSDPAIVIDVPAGTTIEEIQ